ncbi:efflux RND transporter periplasmic adaptor subunit [Clostridium aestuarii]|uniref:Efflux RND transporter periplasmic adaptor subunit n=1 Tax=Clostridium aestuarii TaxID=338193 RepID=A0ABT4CVF3_9CLOT|nr:efflux RND transporter periplasmic adaptor subunit [Clostridium aestuarii]MCY6482946.1 efflux RND transporter periplasmic adaptor subunit [Clostridium aestuarii]
MKSVNKAIISAMIISTTFTGCGVSSLSVTGDNLIQSKDQNLVVQGQVETDETTINTKVPGNIIEVKVSEGDKVKKGDVLIRIANDAMLAKKAQADAAAAAATGQMKAAEAAKNAAMAQSEKAENGAKAEVIAKAKAAYDFVQEAHKFAKDSYERVHALYEQGIATQQQDEEASTKLKEVAMKVEIAKQTYDEALNGAREEDKLAAKALVSKADSMIQAAKGQVLQAQAASKEVSTYIADSVITAPTDGVVTTVNPKVGELVSTGMPLITISKTSNLWLEVKVPETELSMVSVGKKVNVKLLAYKDESFEGEIVRVNKKPDFATKRATNDNGQYDILSYGVKIKFSKMDKELYPGMTALVDFGNKEDAKKEDSKKEEINQENKSDAKGEVKEDTKQKTEEQTKQDVKKAGK